MRIAILTEVFLPKIDGVTNRLSHTVECLVELGHEVLVFAPDTAVAEHAGARVVRIPGLPFPPYPGLRASLPDPRLVLELRRFSPHVVHAVGPACLGIWGTMAADLLRIPVVASYHTDFPRYLPGYGMEWARPAVWPLIRAVHGRALLNLAPSRFTQRELREHGVDCDGLWRGGVDTVQFHPEKRCIEMRTRLAGGRPDGPVLLYVGRLSPEKKLETLKPLLEAVPEARLALVGDGPSRASLEACFEGLPASFLGFQRGEALARAFASADVFVMPSTTETLGFVALEAMSAGLPVVAANAGGLPDIVQHGVNGLLYDPERPEGLVAAVRELLESDTRRRHCALQARKSAEEGSWLAETEKLTDQYRKAVVLGMNRGLVGRLAHALFS